MKVLFLYVSTNMCRDGDLWYYDEGIASVAACLRDAGHSVAFRMVGDNDDLDGVSAWVEDQRAGHTMLVFLTSLMFSAYGHDLPQTMPIVGKLKETTGLRAGFVGLHATMNPEDVLAHPGVDFVGRGEMDEALVEFCNALDAGASVHDIRNFWVKDDDQIHRNDLRPLIQDMTALPFPARDLLEKGEMANERDGILTVIAMRGCPMDCNFCSNPVLKRLYDGNGRWTRFKPVGYVIDEIRSAMATSDSVRAVFFHDDIFAMNKVWAAEFFERYPKEIGIPYGCNLVIEQSTPEFVAGLAHSGCRQVQIGVESGSDYLRNEVINKGIDDAQIRDALKLYRDAGIVVKCFAMMGLPKETRWRYRESVRNFAGYRADMVQIQVWEAHEGSDLLSGDPEAGEMAHRHYRPGADRRAWRIKFFFRYFHRFIACYEVLDERRRTKPVRAWLMRRLVDAAIMLPWTPELLLTRDWNGRRRWTARVWGGRWVRRLGRRIAGAFWDEVTTRELRLASVYIWPADLGPPPGGRGWMGAIRVDGRGRRAAATTQTA